MGDRILWIRTKRLPKAILGGMPIPFVYGAHARARCECLREIATSFTCMICRFDGNGHHGVWCCHAIQAHRCQRIGERCICQREVRVDLDGMLEVLYAAAESFLRSHAEEVPAL